MINAPSGSAVGMPSISGASCSTAPPPLVGGGLGAPTPVQSPLQAPLSTPLANAQAGVGAIPPGGGLVAATPALSMPPIVNAAALGAAGAPMVAAPASIATPLAAPAVSTITPAAAATGAAPAAAATATAAPQRLTSLAPGGSAADANLVEQTLGTLRQSAGGSQLVDRLLAVGARINVISDAEFKGMGHGDAHAFYDPKIDTMFLRRSDLADAKNMKFAAVALAHEGTHLLDDVGRIADPFINAAATRVQAAGGPGTPQGAAAQQQVLFELTMMKEARAFTFAGQVARDLGVTTPPTDPTSIAAAGGNDQATYAKVWQALLSSSYNPDRRTAAVANF
ncbi:MAG: hypothetical protein JWM86_2593 [Thermoleophilia bacterium]|nr:hypothetical protein [Thermoleophilia bacterium]